VLEDISFKQTWKLSYHFKSWDSWW